MFRRCVSICMLVVASSYLMADVQEVDPHLKSGAEFVWELSKLRQAGRVYPHFESAAVRMRVRARVELDEESVERMPMLISRFAKLPELESKIAIVDQRPLAIDSGNQFVTYRLQAKRGDVMFIEVHLVGPDEVTIVGVREVTPNEVINRIRGAKMLEVKPSL